MTTQTTGSSALRRALLDAADTSGSSLKDLTVLAPQNDPFRIDTASSHRDGKWQAIARFQMVVHGTVSAADRSEVVRRVRRW